jgi:hypothetical protein
MPGTTLFDVMSIGAPIFIGVVFVLIVVMVVVRVVRVRKAGHNPLTLDADIALKLMDSDLLSASGSKQAQLKEVEALHASGQVTESERDAARAAILSGQTTR